jgi:type II secretion system protein G
MLTKTVLKMSSSTKSRGFTLVELLIVIAIILILISIALPNFLEARTRASITAARGDMRSVGLALEMYNVDYKTYPDAIIGYRVMRRLTTPNKYMSSVPPDLFVPQEEGLRPYRYGAMDVNRPTRWLLASRGPDREKNTSPIDFYPGNRPGLFIGLYVAPLSLGGEFKYMMYSPTNGTISVGDLYQASDCTPM